MSPTHTMPSTFCRVMVSTTGGVTPVESAPCAKPRCDESFEIGPDMVPTEKRRRHLAGEPATCRGRVYVGDLPVPVSSRGPVQLTVLVRRSGNGRSVFKLPVM